MDPEDTVPPEAPITERCYTQPEPEHEPFGPQEYSIRRATFLPTPFDLSSEDLEDDQS